MYIYVYIHTHIYIYIHVWPCTRGTPSSCAHRHLVFSCIYCVTSGVHDAPHRTSNQATRVIILSRWDISMYICKSIYVYVCVNIITYIYIHMHIYTYTYRYVHIYVTKYVYMHLHLHMHIMFGLPRIPRAGHVVYSVLTPPGGLNHTSLEA